MNLKIKIALVGFAIQLTSVGCSDTITETENTSFDPNVLVGEWRVDSSSDGEDLYNKLVILEDGVVYNVDWSNGGGVRKYSKYTFDSIQTEYGDKLFVSVIDSNRISVTRIFEGINYYSRRPHGETDIQEYLKADSLRRRIIGWWKVRPGRFPFELVNSGITCDSFTLQIRGNGEATFYADNLIDSSIYYNYRMTSTGISLTRGCVVSDYPIYVLDDSTIQIEFEHRMYLKFSDTLTLDKIKQIR